MTVCTSACEQTLANPTITIRIIDSWNQEEAAKATTLRPYSATPPSMNNPLGMRSPNVAIITALANAPIPMAVRRNPWPGAPTSRMSRAKTGKSVVNGTMNREANIDQQARAHRLVLPAELPTFDNTATERDAVNGTTMSIGGSALGGAQLQRPERAQNVKHRLGAVRT